MANVTGQQPEVKYCPRCKGDLRNVPRSAMVSKGYKRKDGTVSPHTHTYDCQSCGTRFSIKPGRSVRLVTTVQTVAFPGLTYLK